MKRSHWFLVMMGLLITAGCSGDTSYARHLILEAFPRPAAVQFGEFTSIDATRACYEVSVKNFNGEERRLYIALRKERAEDKNWHDWAATSGLSECREAYQ